MRPPNRRAQGKRSGVEGNKPLCDPCNHKRGAAINAGVFPRWQFLRRLREECEIGSYCTRGCGFNRSMP